MYSYSHQFNLHHRSKLGDNPLRTIEHDDVTSIKPSDVHPYDTRLELRELRRFHQTRCTASSSTLW